MSVANSPADVQPAALDEIRRRQQLAASRVPPHLHDGLVEYLVNHRPPGSFLCSVLSNDLLGACKRGDEQSRAHLVDLVLWLYEQAPIPSWGSVARVRTWLQKGEQ